MDQDQRVDCSIGNQFGGHNGLAKRGGRTQDTFVMPKRLPYGLSLIVTKMSLKLHINGVAGVTFIANQHTDLVLLQDFAHLEQAASWKSEMLSELFAAGDDARLIPNGKSHRLGFVEFRILKRRDTDDPVEHCLGEVYLWNEYQIASHYLNRFWERAWDGFLALPSRWKQGPRRALAVVI